MHISTNVGISFYINQYVQSLLIYIVLYDLYNPYGGFHKWGIPKMVGLYREIPIKMDDLGAPLF